MPNTFPAALICSVCCDVALTGICQILAPLTNFANDCSSDPLAPGKPVVVPVATAGSNTLTNPSDFEQGDGTLESRTITPDYVSQPFHITAQQYQQGYRLEQLAKINAEVFAAAIWAKVMPLIKNAAAHVPPAPPTGFPLANVHVQGIAGFTPATVGVLYGLLKCMPKHLILDPAAMSKLLYVAGGCCFPMGGSGPTGFGFQTITEHTQWAGADANTYGFAFCREAIAVVSGVPVSPPECGQMIAQRSVTLPGSGLTVQFNMWCSSKTRSVWGSYDIMFGAALGVPCKGVLLKSA